MSTSNTLDEKLENLQEDLIEVKNSNWKLIVLVMVTFALNSCDLEVVKQDVSDVKSLLTYKATAKEVPPNGK